MQRRMTKIESKLRDLAYDQRLKELDLTTFETRHIRGNLIRTCKLLTDKEEINFLKIFPIEYI